MKLPNILLTVLVGITAVSSAGAQTTSAETNSGALISIPKTADAVPPAIQIIEPADVGARGLRIASGDAIVVTEGQLRIRGIARSTRGIAFVYVNGSEAELKPIEGGCEFTMLQYLQPGPNTIVVTALDVNKNSSKVVLEVRRESAPSAGKPAEIVETFRKNQVWAVVVGISQYESPDIQALRYADADAESFYQYLIAPLEKGGRGVSAANIRKLINRDATKRKIQEAIFDFMKNPLEEDIVILYFACHGAPDPYRPNIPYLLAYDSDLGAPAATAVKMQDIQDAIRDYIKAKKIIVFADACHSAGISAPMAQRGLETSVLINNFLADIRNSDNSVLTFSASEAKESSMESPQWGGGHGVFTNFILEGLSGKADVDGDRIVRLGELVDYVGLNVRRETKSLQHPIPSSTLWDRNLPMSIVPTGQ